MRSEIPIVVPTYPPIPIKMTQHFRGWVEILRDTLQRSFEREDVDVVICDEHDLFWRWEQERIDSTHCLMIYNGINYLGDNPRMPVNVWGGITSEHGYELIKRFSIVEKLLESDRVRSLEFPIPDYSYSCGHKAKQLGSGHPLGEFIPRMKQICDAVPTHLIWQSVLPDKRFDTICIGDSHTGASWRPNSIALRNDRETLHGVLKRGLKSKILDRLELQSEIPEHIKRLVVHYGNIDIRHHLCRIYKDRSEQSLACIELVSELVRQIDAMEMEEVVLVKPYPIENSSRKVTKSVMYEEEPFWGSWKDRSHVSEIIGDLMEEACAIRDGWSTLGWDPSIYTNERGELKFEVMERPRSIHLSPEYYYWDLKNDRPNDFGVNQCSQLDKFL